MRIQDAWDCRVGVGIMITHNPLHGSGQAALPHPALASSNDAHATEGIGVTDRGHRQPACDEAPHTVPEKVAVLASSRQRTMPEPPHLEAKTPQRRLIHGHAVVADVSTPPLAATGPVPGWVYACAAESRFSPRSASPATFCESSAAARCTFRCFSSLCRYA